MSTWPNLHTVGMSNELVDVVLGPELRDRKTASDHIADALRKAILTGALPDGAVLNQVTTAHHFGVSRVPVREAMRQLQAEGLISAEAHRQPVVRSLSIETIAEMCELRALIEEYLIERAIPNVDEDLLQQLSEISARMNRVTEHREWLRMNGEFHSLLYRSTNATIAIEMAEGLRGRVERYLSLWSRGEGMKRSAEAGREHQLILELVRSRNVAGAREQVHKHIMRTLQRIRELYGHRTGGDAATIEPETAEVAAAVSVDPVVSDPVVSSPGGAETGAGS
jgi:DNA-binding GntR family transcriptional regulator